MFNIFFPYTDEDCAAKRSMTIMKVWGVGVCVCFVLVLERNTSQLYLLYEILLCVKWQGWESSQGFQLSIISPFCPVTYSAKQQSAGKQMNANLIIKINPCCFRVRKCKRSFYVETVILAPCIIESLWKCKVNTTYFLLPNFHCDLLKWQQNLSIQILQSSRTENSLPG